MATKKKAKRGAKRPQALTVRNYAWGAIYQGTAEQLIAAKLATREHLRSYRSGMDSISALVPVDYAETGMTPERGYPTYSAEIQREYRERYTWTVFVRYPVSDLDPAAQRERIREQFVTGMARLLTLLLSTVPEPLSDTLARRGVVAVQRKED